jgi:signal transduction histidine kinase
VQEHQGSLRVETEVGNYAEFIITLPKASNWQPSGRGIIRAR